MKAQAEMSEGQLVFVLTDDQGESVAILRKTTTTTLKKFLLLVCELIDE